MSFIKTNAYVLSVILPAATLNLCHRIPLLYLLLCRYLFLVVTVNKVRGFAERPL